MRDIVVQSTINEQIVALSREPGVLGELVSLQFLDTEPFHARVVESTPIIVDGSVRHQLRLHQVRAAGSATDVELDNVVPGSLATE